MINTKLFYLIAFLFFLNTKAQDCNSLYIVNAQNGNVYNISALNGTLPAAVTNLNAAARSNLAVGPNPANTSQTVFTSSNTPANSPVYVSNATTGNSIPVSLGGLTANPVAGATQGHVYGVSSTRRLIRANPTPADLGAITGDGIWSAGTVSSDAFFDSTGRLYVIVTSGSARYLYRIDIATLAATQVIQLSGTLPTSFQGLAFYNGNIYAVEGFSATIFFVSSFGARVYEINPNTGASTLRTSYTLNTLIGPFSGADDLDLASCQVFTPSTAPTCNELFGISGTDGITYRIDFNSSGGISGTTSVATDGSGGFGNMAYGPVPSNLNQNQFVVSRNANTGRIWAGIATSANTTLTQQGNTSTTWGSPIGIGTDPKTGFVYGINGKTLTRWTGTTAAATTLGDITGDTNWTNGTTLNDIAVDSGGNLYVIVAVTNSSIWLYRINPTALTAAVVTQLNGTVPNLATTIGNGLAYLGDFFYYSRINGNGTDIWRLNAMTGASTFVGNIAGAATAGNRRDFGDLGSCATVTNVPAAFTFDCTAAGGGVQGAKLLANGTSQSSVLRIPISNAVNGLAEFTLTGTGISTSPSPYIATIDQGATFVDIPFTFNGGGSAGNRVISISSPRASGACNLSVLVDIDSDGDGIANSDDLDDDNDGILDTDEGFCATNSVYTMNVASTVSSGTSTFNANGATFNLVYTLTSGAQVAGLGSTFNVPFTYSDFNNTATSVNHTWETIVNNSNLAVGILPNTNSLYTSLPANNTTNQTITAASGTTGDSRFRYWLATRTLNQLGTFTTTVGNLPAISGQLSSLQNFNNPVLSQLASFNYSTAGSNATSGYYAKLKAQISGSTEDPYPVPFGSTNLWDYTAFDGPGAGNANNGGNRGLITLRQNTITFCNHRDTDGDGIPDYLDLDSDNDGCSDANEYYNNANADGGDGGVYGTGTPVVDATGKVTAAAYTSSTATNVTSATQAVLATQPFDDTATVGTTTSFSVTASARTTSTFSAGTPNYTIPPASNSTANITYQWQVSTDNGSTWTNITNGSSYSGATTSTLFVNNVTLAQNGNRFRVQIGHSSRICTSIVSNGALLSVTADTSCTPSAEYPDSDGDGISDFCDKDDDNDGILDIVECPSYVTSPNIFVQSGSGISSFNVNTNTLSSNSFCSGNLNVTRDIAVNSAGTMYGVYNSTSPTVNNSTLAIINPTNCNVTTVIADLGFVSTSLSFLPDGTLLASGGSKIYRIDLSNNSVTEWHNYTTGSANGDFIYINGKVYVLWFDAAVNATNPFIREVTVDANNNFVSSVDLGFVQAQAFGLAKANGNELYAATGNNTGGGQGTIIKINYKATPFSWNVIYTSSVSLLGATSSDEDLKECDTDKDGIPNRLDLDSDGDGCPDAVEGSGTFTNSDLVTSTTLAGGNSGTGYTGTSTSPVVRNLPTPVDLVTTSATYGVPIAAGTGQAIGDSQNGAVSSQCLGACYKPAVLDAVNTYPTKHGITALGRAGADNQNWPMLRQSAWTVLESKEKGFVVNRVPTTASLANITNPVEGMIVYDEEADCLKIYTLKEGEMAMAWHCFTTPACPD
ncbi:beta strand repeat-containing protein [Chryseobacterium binzhouense]|uniref:beta strand repeat-containing protein n=1 Tax=Chryseobacterium binzhouense TaxID=2593646 RepID=UPI00289FAD92|nr:hypothetical protein [Chryseobacterium binzhouense]